MVKLTAKGANFEIARKKLDKALREFRIRGIKTNIPFICNVLENEKFIRSATTTNFVDETPELFDLAGSKGPRAAVLCVTGPGESNEESGGRISIVTPDGRPRRILRRLTSLRLFHLASFAFE